MEIPDVDPEQHFELPGVYMEGKEAPLQLVDVDDPNIPQDSIIVLSEVPAGPNGPTQVSTPAT